MSRAAYTRACGTRTTISELYPRWYNYAKSSWPTAQIDAAIRSYTSLAYSSGAAAP